MSAWIEIFGSLKKVVTNTVALYMSAWIEMTVTVLSRASNVNVALYMSAWIEIHEDLFASGGKNCRTLHECVD